MAKREIAERIDGHLTVEASTSGHEVAYERGEREAASDRRAVRSLVRSISDFQPTRAAAASASGYRRPLSRGAAAVGA